MYNFKAPGVHELIVYLMIVIIGIIIFKILNL